MSWFSVGVQANSTLPSRLVKPSMRGVSPACVAGRLLIVFTAFRQAAVGFHAQHAVNQRAAGEELAVISVTAIAVFLNGGIAAEGTGPFLADFFGNDIDHAAERIGTVQGRHRAAHYFDPLDGSPPGSS